ncbi:two-component system sensor histidine kinase NtrB [Desulfogranum mediterraneum]|uniref:two-component system sensor histidine kinase NtrB n=1 Tax=Desulfogranum mediterraneum TaxID=160661 RepID=UPI000406F33C|nr:ATP-binding protein [Desulfogranum mediterraneum]
MKRFLKRIQLEHSFPKIIIGLVALLVAALLSINYLSQQRLRQISRLQIQNLLENEVQAVNNFLQERSNDLYKLSLDRILLSYFENRALGMSMAYGLGVSLANTAITLEQIYQANTLGGQPIYAQLSLLNLQGEILTSFPRSSPGTITLPQGYDKSSKRPQLFPSGMGQIQLLTPLFLGTTTVGSIRAEISLKTMARLLLNPASHKAFSTFSYDKKVLYSSRPEYHLSDSFLLLFSSPLPPTPLDLELGLIHSSQQPRDTAWTMFASQQAGSPLRLFRFEYTQAIYNTFHALMVMGVLALISAGLILGLAALSSWQERAFKAHRLQATVLEQVPETIIVTDIDGIISYVNPAFEQTSGYARTEVIGQRPAIFRSGLHDLAFYQDLWKTIRKGRTWSGHFSSRKKDGSIYHEDATIAPVRDSNDRITHFVAVKKDVTQLLEMQRQLAQGQKLEAIGRLAAGIAHEINTPTQFVLSNTSFLEEAFQDLDTMIRGMEKLLLSPVPGAVQEQQGQAVAELQEQADWSFLGKEIPEAISQSLLGLRRVAAIVSAMKRFAHPSEGNYELTDINQCLQSTTTVARNEWKYVAEVAFDLDPELPEVPGNADELNQVFLNIIVNAAQALGEQERHDHQPEGIITIATRTAEQEIEIIITDNGCGMDKELREKIFEPFFTTKELGQGTGQGLAIARDVVEKHQGSIRVSSGLHQGTSVTVALPRSGSFTDQQDLG